ncbi:MAG: nucleotidyl transferase AbiEii/AbiGii toxin family protein, partial [bacterium]
QIDTEPQNFTYKSQQIILNKFDVFLKIRVVPSDILLSQKIFAIFNCRRSLGRDFYDTVFLMGRVKPNYSYLHEKMAIVDKAGLKKKLLAKCKTLDLKRLAKDVEPFLFNPDDTKRVEYFSDYINGM